MSIVGTKVVGDRQMSEMNGTMKATLTAAVFMLAILLAALGAASANAAAPVDRFETIPSTTQAGGHPDVEIALRIGNRSTQGFNEPCFCNDPKIVTVHLPGGVIGNPHVTPQCTSSQLVTGECPRDSQVGVVYTLLYGPISTPEVEGEGINQYMELYNMVPNSEQAGLLAFVNPFSGTATYVELSARTGSDYGLDAITTGIEKIIPLYEVHQWLWGVPAAHVHDALRSAHGSCEGSEILPSLKKRVPPPAGYCYQNPGPTTSNSPELPFMSNPTTCAGPLTSSADTLSYDRGTAHGETPYAAITGCDQLSFNPSLSAKPTTTETDTASGLDIDLSVPQLESPTTPSPSEIKATTVTLPNGFSINPNAADGKISCSDAEARFGTEEAAQCPDFSKVGTLTLESSALPGPIPGYIYLGDPRPGERFRLILTADGFATHVKLAGSAVPDPQTGQLVTSFTNLPQSPLTEFKLHFFGSERGLLATPTQCGTYAVHSTFTPWDGSLAEQNATQFFTLDSGPTGSPCPGAPRPFTPTFAAASAGNTGGAHSPFTVTVGRSDGDQNLTGLKVTTPPGFAATLRGVQYCGDLAITQLGDLAHTGLGEQISPSCPAASQVGTAVAGVGAGTHPLYNSGKVYLAGPYHGAPLSLEVVFPALTGPYDLGNVAVRAGIHVDPLTAQVSTTSDPLPQILEGVPLRIRSIQVNLDRPGFALNPTNCDPLSVEASVIGDEGSEAKVSAPYQVANCARLPFAPKLTLKLTGSTKQAGNPALTATLTAKPGEANISRAQVTLPPTELVDNAHIRNICTRVQFNEGKTPGEKCPPGSILGFAKADTPLLEKPLEGPIYLRSTGRAGLPDVVAALNGQIDIVLDGHVDSVHGGLRTTFETVPDAPVTKVVLSFDGGHKGIIENSPQLCAHAQHFTAAITGQDGKTANRRPVLSTPCGKKHKRKARAHHNRRAHR